MFGEECNAEDYKYFIQLYEEEEEKDKKKCKEAFEEALLYPDP